MRITIETDTPSPEPAAPVCCPPPPLRPLVILVEGQSNAYLERDHVWVVPANLKVWNYTKVPHHVGTAFVKPSGTVMGLALGIGKKLAEENPDRQIYVINISLSGNTISAWLPGAAPDNDVWAETIANVPLALAAAGTTEIDRFYWWQGESDRIPGLKEAYPTNFETLMARFRTQSWFPQDVITTIFGVTSGAISGDPTYGDMNPVLQSVVNADPQRRKFFYTACVPATYWNDVPNLHMTGAGYELAGSLAVSSGMGQTSGIVESAPVALLPVIRASGTPGVITYGPVREGRAYFNGRRVDFTASVEVTSWSGSPSGGMVVELPGLPQPNCLYACTVWVHDLTFSGPVSGRVYNSGSYTTATIELFQAASGMAVQALPVDTSFTVTVSGFYYT